MPEAISVPVLFVSEPIVLPTMVVPVELDDAARDCGRRRASERERKAADRAAAR